MSNAKPSKISAAVVAGAAAVAAVVADNVVGMTVAQAAALVKRTTIIEAGGQQRTKTGPIGADEVLAFRDYGSHVVVVTIDGHKFSSADAAA